MLNTENFLTLTEQHWVTLSRIFVSLPTSITGGRRLCLGFLSLSSTSSPHSLVHSIGVLLSSSIEVRFLHVYCESNMIDDFMAKLDVPSDGSLLRLSAPPPGLFDVLQRDILGPPHLCMRDS
ncbi:hypothetical protein V6N13_023611 [Hibiscus sabdariffa]